MTSSTFLPRTTAPATVDKNWIYTGFGGNNKCILIKEKSVLPNCVGYAWGRWWELLNSEPKLSRKNAEDWYATNDGYERGQTPKLGAVACWRKGKAGDGKDGAGHVAIVEEILNDGTIITSNSGYLGSYFYMRTIKAPYNLGGTYVFQGFIYLPQTFVAKEWVLKPIDDVAKEVILGEWGHGADRKSKLTARGYDYNEVQAKVNWIISQHEKNHYTSIDVLVQDIIAGKLGNGLDRKQRIINAGYNYEEVQTKVNIALSLKNNKKPIVDIANEVIQGKWGSGLDRKKALEKSGYNYLEVQNKVNEIIKKR